MTKIELQDALAQCAVEVLEQMFFVQPSDQSSDTAPADSDLICSVDFVGEPSGRLELRVTADAARSVAAGFLGEEEDALSDFQVGQVVCELANIVCGSVLSRIESKTTFHLDSPQLVSEWAPSPNREVAEQTVPLDKGDLTIRLGAERPL